MNRSSCTGLRAQTFLLPSSSPPSETSVLPRFFESACAANKKAGAPTIVLIQYKTNHICKSDSSAGKPFILRGAKRTSCLVLGRHLTRARTESHLVLALRPAKREYVALLQNQRHMLLEAPAAGKRAVRRAEVQQLYVARAVVHDRRVLPRDRLVRERNVALVLVATKGEAHARANLDGLDLGGDGPAQSAIQSRL